MTDQRSTFARQTRPIDLDDLDAEKEEEQIRSGIKTILLMPFFLGYLAAANGFVLSRLWLWHAVPLGTPPLRWHVFAVGLLAFYVVRASPNVRKDERTRAEQALALVLSLLVPWAALLVGWMWS